LGGHIWGDSVGAVDAVELCCCFVVVLGTFGEGLEVWWACPVGDLACTGDLAVLMLAVLMLAMLRRAILVADEGCCHRRSILIAAMRAALCVAYSWTGVLLLAVSMTNHVPDVPGCMSYLSFMLLSVAGREAWCTGMRWESAEGGSAGSRSAGGRGGRERRERRGKERGEVMRRTRRAMRVMMVMVRVTMRMIMREAVVDGEVMTGAGWGVKGWGCERTAERERGEERRERMRGEEMRGEVSEVRSWGERRGEMQSVRCTWEVARHVQQKTFRH
jgi:hypothetical protein